MLPEIPREADKTGEKRARDSVIPMSLEINLQERRTRKRNDEADTSLGL
jgi:hypothetical protein